MKLGRAAAFCAIAGLAAGCVRSEPHVMSRGGSSRSGTASPAASVAASPTAGIGDLRAVDPCSLLDPSQFPAGDLRFDDDTSSLFSCTRIASDPALSQAANHQTMQVTVIVAEEAPQVGAAPGGSVPRPRAFAGRTVRYISAHSSSCQEWVEFEIGNVVLVRSTNGTDQTTVCALADRGMDSVIDAVVAGRVRHLDYPANSFVRADVCAVLTPATIRRAIPSFEVPVVVGAPMGTGSCFWTTRDGRWTIALTLVRAGPQSEGNRVAVSARPVYFAGDATAGYGTCALLVPHVPLAGAVAGTVEAAALAVSDSSSRELGIDACAPAIALANVTAPLLPKP